MQDQLPKKITLLNLFEKKLMGMLEKNIVERQEKKKTMEDKDMLFLSSLKASLKSIRPDLKLQAKIEILSILDKYNGVSMQEANHAEESRQVKELWMKKIMM